MKEVVNSSFMYFLGLAVVILAISFYKTQESAQKIENIETLYMLKTNLNNRKFIQETDLYIKQTQKLIDSIENNEHIIR